MSITDVTERIGGATAGKEGEAFATALRQESARIEGACATGRGTRCEVVNLFHGGKYHLYRYRRFQDVRLVLAPRVPDGGVRRLRRQLRVPALRLRRRVRPGLRERHSGRDSGRAPLGVGPGRRGRSRSSCPATRVARSESPPSSSWGFSGTSSFPGCWYGWPSSEERCSSSREEARENFRISRARLRTVENSLKALGGRRAWLANPANFDAEARGGCRAAGCGEEGSGEGGAVRRCVDGHRAGDAGGTRALRSARARRVEEWSAVGPVRVRTAPGACGGGAAEALARAAA